MWQPKLFIVVEFRSGMDEKRFGGRLLRFACMFCLFRVSDRLKRNESKTGSVEIDSEGNCKTLVTESIVKNLLLDLFRNLMSFINNKCTRI